VSLQKIGRQLRREFKTNPKKAVALGVLFLVAAYFWAPLLMKSKGPETATKPATTTAQTAPTAGAVAETPTKTTTSQYRWQDLDREMNRDPRMNRTLDDLVERLGRNPFAAQAVAVAVVETKPEAVVEEPRTPAIVTPADAGLSLSGTVLGNRRTALISGKVYEEGREVESKDGLVFRVKVIQSRRIVLERAGQQFELVMARGRSLEATPSVTTTPSTTSVKEDDQ
jgi:hypothetical protein